MNQLLKSLEGFGYIRRSSAPDEGRARMVRFTRRGHSAYAKIYEILIEIESEWRDELGVRRFREFKKMLARIWESPLVR
jgi:DNA-binding MarR family transcriptional regulator